MYTKVEKFYPKFQLEYPKTKERDFFKSQFDLNWCYQRNLFIITNATKTSQTFISYILKNKFRVSGFLLTLDRQFYS